MREKAKILNLNIAEGKRIIAIADVHGELSLFKNLLDKVNFFDRDVLILVGDLYFKGSQPHETLKFCMELSKQENVYVLRGNCDWGGDDYISENERIWLENLPHIIETQNYTFVHAGLENENIHNQDAMKCMKTQNFMNVSQGFDKWVIVGHWPVSNYHTKIPNHNPLINEEKKIISIDGGNVIAPDGQLNAFIIENGKFSSCYVDKFILTKLDFQQAESGGTLNISYVDNDVEVLETNGELRTIKHLSTGKILTVPTTALYYSPDGKPLISDMATDYHLPHQTNDDIGVVAEFDDRIFAKKNGICGWIKKEQFPQNGCELK